MKIIHAFSIQIFTAPIRKGRQKMAKNVKHGCQKLMIWENCYSPVATMLTECNEIILITLIVLDGQEKEMIRTAATQLFYPMVIAEIKIWK